jgi:membrane peptidoglycan carboxypeptidase
MSAQNPPRRGLLAALLGTLAFSAIAGILVTALVTPAIAVTSVTAQSAIGIFDSLPTYIEIGTQAQRNAIFANFHGKPYQIATVFNENREEVKWEAVSQAAKDAAVDGEDRRFYSHGGVDPTGVVRAVLVGATGGSVQGASTIAQQLVKNILIQQALQITNADPKKQAAEQAAGIKSAQAVTLDRKLKEMKLAISLEKKYTKQQILLAYLNIAGFGGTTYGIEAAAERYYGVHASDLTPVQAATLIAIVQKPTARAPINAAGYVQNTDRRNHILQAMYQAHDITKAQYDAGIAVKEGPDNIKNSTPQNGCIAADASSKWFCDYVTKLIPSLTSLGATKAQRLQNWSRGGYDIYTSEDLSLQRNSQSVVWKYVPKYTPILNLGAATTSVEMGTGRIITMGENKNFNDTAKGGGNTSTAVNYATDFPYGGSGGFQGGSTYKAFTLINWLQNGHGLNEVVNGSARTVQQSSFTDTCPDSSLGGSYPFRNDVSSESGPYTIMRATAGSINGAFISMAQQLDLCNIQKVAMSLGVHTAKSYTNKVDGVYGNDPETNPSSVLGTNTVSPLTMAAAYAGIGDHGLFCEPTAVDSIVGPDGKKMPGQAKNCTQAVNPQIAEAATYALQGPLGGGPAGGSGTGGASNPRDNVAQFGKTGTTNDSLQTWTVGGNSKVATAVWVGNIQGKVPTRSVYISGMQAAVLRHALFKPIERAIDQAYHPAASFPVPSPTLLNGSGTKVPSVLGLSVAAATSVLQAAGFTVTVSNSTVTSAAAAGIVAKQNPAAGSLLSSGYEITLFKSNGSLLVVPNVVGDGNNDFSDAQSILQNAGFSNISQGCTVVNTPSQVNKVVSSNPGAGAQRKASENITVNIGAVNC